MYKNLIDIPIYEVFENYYLNPYIYNRKYRIFIENEIPNGLVEGIFSKVNVNNHVMKYLNSEYFSSAYFNFKLKYNGLYAEELSQAFTNKLLYYYNLENNNVLMPNIKYQAHCENIGWQAEKSNGEYAGTKNQGLRLEAIIINSEIPIRYRTHCENVGWTQWVNNGEISGTVGKGLRMEAIEIQSEHYSLKGQGHVEKVGDQAYVIGKNIFIGTEGRGLRLEGFTLQILNN